VEPILATKPRRRARAIALQFPMAPNLNSSECDVRWECAWEVNDSQAVTVEFDTTITSNVALFMKTVV